ncbi:transposase [Polyangium mundeleinium]|uniref:Transposase n=1 Tax=Polyangium mundeleinium TaxID=2995306 RepID=A0ABT5EU13_9BACT|nr:transposase [Polyangium mundeleinium]MDC0744939.1 transposase [Polyangium mundeleinium]
MGLAGAAHSSHEGHRYERHRPEETVLYRVVAAHWQSFRERVETIGPLPRFVVREVEEYLRCGILEYGFIRVACEGCGFERLVSFSCKRRGFCPSCLGRRMSDGAVHLTEHVLPEVPIRQWVCSLPWGLRTLVGYDRELCAEVVRAFVEELLRSLRRRAKHLFGLASVEHVFAGAVTFIQRFDSALRLNVHVHTLALDGIYVRDDTTGEPAFRALPAPTAGEVYEIAERTAKRVVATLKKRGRSVDGLCDEGNTSEDFDPALAACYGAAARAPALRVVERDRTRDDERMAVVMGFDVHAGAAIDGRDRKRVERLCRYLARPPIAQERLVEVAGGKLRYELKKVWRDGTRFVVFEPHEFLARVCAMIPPPRFHMIRFHGVLAPNAALRSHVVAAARPSALAGESTPATL